MINTILNESAQLNQQLTNDTAFQAMVENVSTACVNALKNGHKILLCGNGGSFADAQHIAAEFVGRFIKERNALPAIALGCNASNTTAIGNDYGFDTIFSRELSSLGTPGDILIGISTSGNSRNVLNAIATAKEMNIHPFGLTGNQKGALTKACPCIEVPSNSTPRIQECHILVGHIICSVVDDAI
ncbi:MAG: D-sedoheptulose-7-phosphate isomerase [Candidatus Marinamargulisbacteria bacterium]